MKLGVCWSNGQTPTSGNTASDSSETETRGGYIHCVELGPKFKMCEHLQRENNWDTHFISALLR